MRPILTFGIILALTSGSLGEEISEATRRALIRDALSPSPQKQKANRQECRFAPSTLIGLSRDQLRAKCGIWSTSNLTTTAAGTSEQLVFNILPNYAGFYVYLTNGVVTAVQSR